MGEATVVRPDLSALPREVRVRIAVAETQGFAWEADGDGYRWLIGPRGEVGASRAPGDGAVIEGPGLPDPFNDPAACGALMEREAIGLVVGGHEGAAWWRGVKMPWCLRPGEAVCAAVLSRHGIDWTTLEPVS